MTSFSVGFPVIQGVVTSIGSFWTHRWPFTTVPPSVRSRNEESHTKGLGRRSHSRPSRDPYVYESGTDSRCLGPRRKTGLGNPQTYVQLHTSWRPSLRSTWVQRLTRQGPHTPNSVRILTDTASRGRLKNVSFWCLFLSDSSTPPRGLRKGGSTKILTP